MDDARQWNNDDPAARSVPQPARSLPPGERVYAVGDIHGRADLLAEMQDMISADAARRPPGTMTVVWLGDYVDRGPASREVVDRLLRFAERPHRSIFLMGNHEEALLGFLIDPQGGQHWYRFGGGETLASYGIDSREFRLGHGFRAARAAFLAALPSRHHEFFGALRFSGAIGDFFFCHAGVRPGVGLDAQDPHDLIWIRDEFLHWGDDFGMTIVHGHTPVPEPELRQNRVNVDTGAFATGRLTCAVIEGSEIGFLSTGMNR